MLLESSTGERLALTRRVGSDIRLALVHDLAGTVLLVLDGEGALHPRIYAHDGNGQLRRLTLRIRLQKAVFRLLDIGATARVAAGAANHHSTAITRLRRRRRLGCPAGHQ